MSAERRIGVVIFLAICVIALLALPELGRAQQTDLSQQMQLFNSLPPDQQQAIMQRLGIGGGSGSAWRPGRSGFKLAARRFGGYSGSQAVLIQQQMLQQQRRQQELQRRIFGPPKSSNPAIPC
jgi:hypothetical protein